MENVYDIIVDAGPAGMTASVYAVRANMKVLMLDRLSLPAACGRSSPPALMGAQQPAPPRPMSSGITSRLNAESRQAAKLS